MVGGLFGCQSGDGWQHPEGVAGEEDDVACVSSAGVVHTILDRGERVGTACVLSERDVVEIRDSICTEDDVLEYGTPHARRGEDLRLVLCREIDHLGVAAPFEVEHACLVPAMLVIPDQWPVRVS